MKFDMYEFFKHNNNIDVFFWVSSAYDDGNIAILNGSWCTQGTESWWATLPDQVQITIKEYDNWNSYIPKGNFK